MVAMWQRRVLLSLFILYSPVLLTVTVLTRSEHKDATVVIDI